MPERTASEKRIDDEMYEIVARNMAHDEYRAKPDTRHPPPRSRTPTPPPSPRARTESWANTRIESSRNKGSGVLLCRAKDCPGFTDVNTHHVYEYIGTTSEHKTTAVRCDTCRSQKCMMCDVKRKEVTRVSDKYRYPTLSEQLFCTSCRPHVERVRQLDDYYSDWAANLPPIPTKIQP